MNGRLGNGSTQDVGDQAGEMGAALTTVPLGTGARATAITTGADFACALLLGGSVKCWGNGALGALGLGSGVTLGDQPGELGGFVPAVDLGAGATAISAGDGHVCAVLTTNIVKCWGGNDAGQLGRPTSGEIGDDPTRWATTCLQYSSATASARSSASQRVRATAAPCCRPAGQVLGQQQRWRTRVRGHDESVPARGDVERPAGRRNRLGVRSRRRGGQRRDLCGALHWSHGVLGRRQHRSARDRLAAQPGRSGRRDGRRSRVGDHRRPLPTDGRRRGSSPESIAAGRDIRYQIGVSVPVGIAATSVRVESNVAACVRSSLEVDPPATSYTCTRTARLSDAPRIVVWVKVVGPTGAIDVEWFVTEVLRPRPDGAIGQRGDYVGGRRRR